MALGSNTLTLTIGEDSKVLNRINQDNYATRYYLHDTTESYTVVVRHSREKLRGVQYEVHNIELQRTKFATDTAPAETQFSWYTIRNQESANRSDLLKTAKAVVITLDDATLGNLMNWVG